ncbi:MAG: sortase [Chloroflexi bacterium]|nr:MAG: sortase [Chloroflexota bacterium]
MAALNRRFETFLSNLQHFLVNLLIIMIGTDLALLGLYLMPITHSRAANAPAGSSSIADAGVSPLGAVLITVIPPVLSPTTAQTSTQPLPANPASVWQSEVPTRLIIPDIQLDAPVVPAVEVYMELSGALVRRWDVPYGYLAGWHGDSARLGDAGNIVINGHHNINGQVFSHLIDINEGAEIFVYGQNQEFHYRVIEKVLLSEKNEPLEVRLANASWIQPTTNPRLTLVTCWPYESNTHRLIVVAEPTL